MQDSLESTIRKLVKDAVREALLEARDSFEFASRQAQPTPKVEKSHEIDSESGERLIDSREASKMLAVSVATVERLTSSGAIPSIKIGNLRRFSISALKQWIHDAESKGKGRTTTDQTERVAPPKDAKPSKQSSKVSAKQSRPQPAFDASKLALSNTTDKEGRKQTNPFRQLLAEIGVRYVDVHPITNGEIRRIAEVDVATCHGWMYLGRPLPQEALNKLKKHFLKLAQNNVGRNSSIDSSKIES